MEHFSKDELSGMQDTQVEAMMDTCELMTRGERGQDEYGQPVVQWTSRTVACGFGTRSSNEYLNAEAPAYDARLRLPIDTVVSQVDRVRITHRFGVQLETGLVYQMIGEPMRGPSGLVVNLKQATL